MCMIRSAVLWGLLVFACGSSAAAAPKADKEAIRAHLSMLADDLLEGRETGTRGFDIAAKYVTAQFMQYGLRPKGDKGSFLQQVPLRSSELVAGSTLVEIASATGVESLSSSSDYIVLVEEGGDRTSAATPMVFVGYGIRAGRFHYDDYAGLDVKGKIVVMLEGKPGSFPSEEGAHFGNPREKRKLAASLGAVGMVLLWTPSTEKRIPFEAARHHFAIPAVKWVDTAGKAAGSLPGMQDTVILNVDASKKLFSQLDAKLDDIYAAAVANQTLPHMDLKMTLRFTRKTVSKDFRSDNVVGMIEGSDPKLKNEYVVFSAHLDHLGQAKEKSGDNIYNGAMDNASGVATLIETARLFSQLAVKPRRSILFIALTGEEKGLLGSGYFAENPTVAIDTIVANVNLDMPLLTFDFKDLVAFGAEHSSLKGSVARAAKRLGLALIADPSPEENFFVRSDHYNFVKQGVPSIFLATGTGSFKKDEDGAKIWKEFRAKHYHKPSDDLNLPFNFDAAARFAQVNFNIARDIANAKDRPTWNQGDFFGDLFKK